MIRNSFYAFAAVFVLVFTMGLMTSSAALAQYDDEAAPPAPDLMPMEQTLVDTDAEEQKIIIRDGAEWDQFWGRSAKGADLPAIDFEQYDLAIYIMGKQSSGGYSSHIISAEPENGITTIKVVNCVPQPDSVSTSVLTVPYATMLIPKTKIQPKWVVWKGMPGHKPCN